MTEPLDGHAARPWEGGASFSRRNRLYRAAWQVTWLLLAAWTPPMLRGWRRLVLRAFGAKLARGANVYGSARVWSPANLEMGEYAAVGPGAIVYAMARVTIGAHAIVSQRAHLCAGTHDVEDAGFRLVARPIAIGARAWVAAEAFVGPGVTIGEGAVLGARAVAMRDVAAWTVCVGNPAVVVRERWVRFP